MISIQTVSSTLLLLAFLLLSVDARSTSPWNRRRPMLGVPSTTASSSSNYLKLPQIRGGDSSGAPSSSLPNNALPTPGATRIGEDDASETNENPAAAEAGNYKIHPMITGGQILRAGKVDPQQSSDASAPTKASGKSKDPEVVVESFVTKEDKATKKILKRHKQIAKKLKVRSVISRCIALHCS